MKSYSLPAILVLILSALFLFVMLQSFGRASRANRDLAEAQEKAVFSRQQLEAVQRAAAAAKQNSLQADKFLETWTTELKAE
ncbi:MAG: hypothetical protein ABSA05_14980, partial [Opitutaceae bacterium]